MNHVLIADNDSLTLKTLTEKIDWTALNCEISGIAGSVPDALYLMEKHRPAVLILDPAAKDLGGSALLNLVRERDEKIQIVVVTDNNNFPFIQEMIRFRISGYLLKPLNPEELTATLSPITLVPEPLRPEQSVKALLNTRPEHQNHHVQMALEQIHKNYSDAELGLSPIAMSFNVTPGHLSRLFKKETGFSLYHYLTLFRIEKAMGFLKNKNLRVREVAAMVGFKDFAHFTSIFTKFVGISPNRYREFFC